MMGILDFIKRKKEGVLPQDPGADMHAMDMGSTGSNYGMPDNTFSPNTTNSMNQPSEYGHDYGQNFGHVNLSTMGASSMNNTQSIYPQGIQNSQNYPTSNSSDKDMQILSLKLDAIKAELDSINQRLRNIEIIAEKEQQPQTKRWY
jgi:hypothetical protein